MSKRYGITREYRVTLPDRGTPEFDALFEAWSEEEGGPAIIADLTADIKKDQPQYPESSVQKIVNLSVDQYIAVWLSYKVDGGDYTELVDIVDDDCWLTWPVTS